MTDVTLSTSQPLDNDLLNDPPPAVSVPGYDRDALTPVIAHIGVGGFHRAHQAAYLHELAEQGETACGVVGVGLRSRDMKEALEPQDLLYTIVERGAEDDEAQVVGTLQRYLYAPDDPEEVYTALADPRIQIVTLTVTGNGYHVDTATGEFCAEADDVVADLSGEDCCRTFHAYVVEALRRRRDAGEAPFTVLSCDNVPRNGEVTRAAVVGFARLQDAELADWIAEHVSFPSSMVDRITPDTGDEACELVSREFSIEDRSPVTTEPFRQWIVEDDFCNGRPPLERVGVQFVADTEPYELLKKRLLNGSHTALGYLGTLAGHRTTDEVMDDPVMRAFVTSLVREEIAPLVPAVDDVDLGEYTDTLFERLANPKMGDELSRLSRRGSTKVPSYLLPSLTDAVAQGAPHRLLTLAVAGWMRYLVVHDEVVDPRLEELQPLVADGDAATFMAERSLFGDLGDDEQLVARVQAAYDLLEQDGPAAAIEREVDA